MSTNERKQPIDFNFHEEQTEEQRKILMQLVEAMGVKELSSRTDRLEGAIDQIQITMNQLIESNNKISQIISSGAPSSSTTIGQSIAQDPMQKFQAIGDFVKTLSDVWNSNKQQPPSSFFGIDPEFVNQEVKASLMSNFEIGRQIQENLKTKLMQKTMTQVLKSAITHEPS